MQCNRRLCENGGKYLMSLFVLLFKCHIGSSETSPELVFKLLWPLFKGKW